VNCAAVCRRGDWSVVDQLITPIATPATSPTSSSGTAHTVLVPPVTLPDAAKHATASSATPEYTSLPLPDVGTLPAPAESAVRISSSAKRALVQSVTALVDAMPFLGTVRGCVRACIVRHPVMRAYVIVAHCARSGVRVASHRPCRRSTRSQALSARRGCRVSFLNYTLQGMWTVACAET
jgi:hypothetical protein